MCFCCCKASLFGGSWGVDFHSFKHSKHAQKVSLSLFISCEYRWTASYWPLKITMQTESIRIQHIKDEDKFRKIQVMNHSSFQEKLEEMQVLSL